MLSRYVGAALLTAALGGCRGVTDLGMPRIGTEYTLVSYRGAPLPAVQFAASYDTLTILDSHLTIFGDTAFLEMRIRDHITAQAAYIDSAISKLTVMEHGDSVRMDYVCDIPGAGSCLSGFVGTIDDGQLDLARNTIPPSPAIYLFQRTATVTR